jgi:hypothetical protein
LVALRRCLLTRGLWLLVLEVAVITPLEWSNLQPAYFTTFEAKRVNRLPSKAPEGKGPEAYLDGTSRTFFEGNTAGLGGSRVTAKGW